MSKNTWYGIAIYYFATAQETMEEFRALGMVENPRRAVVLTPDQQRELIGASLGPGVQFYLDPDQGRMIAATPCGVHTVLELSTRDGIVYLCTAAKARRRVAADLMMLAGRHSVYDATREL